MRYAPTVQGIVSVVQLEEGHFCTPDGSFAMRGPLWGFALSTDPRIFHLTATLWSDAGVAAFRVDRSTSYRRVVQTVALGDVYLNSDDIIAVGEDLARHFGAHGTNRFMLTSPRFSASRLLESQVLLALLDGRLPREKQAWR